MEVWLPKRCASSLPNQDGKGKIMKKFCLTPFQPVAQAELNCQVSLDSHSLFLKYALNRHLDEVFLPTPKRAPERKWDLWESTCFEFFIKKSGAKNYLEFNFSPEHDWNLFFLSDVRVNEGEENSFTGDRLEFKSQRAGSLYTLEVAVRLAGLKVFSGLSPMEEPLEVGISTVIKKTSGELEYWALTHPEEEPDFHQGFVPF